MTNQTFGRYLGLTLVLSLGASSVGWADIPLPTVSPEVIEMVREKGVTESAGDYNFKLETLLSASQSVLKQLSSISNLDTFYYWFSLNPARFFYYSQDTLPQAMVDQMAFAKTQLSDSKLVRLKVIADNLQGEIKQLNADVDDLQSEIDNQKTIAAKDLTGVQSAARAVGIPLASPVTEDVVANIANTKKTIAQKKIDRKYVIAKLVAELKSFDVQASDDQINNLFATVAGDQDIELISSYTTVRELTKIIQKRLEPGHTKIELAQEYYGMYALMIASLVQIQQSQISAIGVFTDTIEHKVIQRNRHIIEEAKGRLETTDNRPLLNQAIKANEEMIVLATKYANYLNARAAKIALLLETHRRSYLDVITFYKTYSAAKNFQELVAKADNFFVNFDTLKLGTLPELMNLGDNNIVDQLTDVTSKIGNL